MVAPSHPEDVRSSEWRRIMHLNFFAAIHGMQVMSPKMIERNGGHIVNTADLHPRRRRTILADGMADGRGGHSDRFESMRCDFSDGLIAAGAFQENRIVSAFFGKLF
jgi:NAD(P)-dependent dehydrogenase (short-subunit alcohol dehydrogenase family)